MVGARWFPPRRDWPVGLSSKLSFSIASAVVDDGVIVPTLKDFRMLNAAVSDKASAKNMEGMFNFMLEVWFGWIAG